MHGQVLITLARHVELVDYDGYEAWRQAGYAGPDPVSSAEVLNSSAQVSPRNSAKYPATFADIVAMIETGKPIPGTTTPHATERVLTVASSVQASGKFLIDLPESYRSPAAKLK